MIQNQKKKIQEFRWRPKLSAIRKHRYTLMLGADDGIL